MTARCGGQPLTGTKPADRSRELRELNRLLFQSERRLDGQRMGCPAAPGIRHQIYAPGYYTGYGVKTLPGVREALEQKDRDESSRAKSPRLPGRSMPFKSR
jgi:hypothetical protein